MVAKKVAAVRKVSAKKGRTSVVAAPAEEVSPPPRKKVILVDGASFYHPRARQALNLGGVKWWVFGNVLKKIGTGTPQDPIYTIWPGTPDHTMKAMTSCGLKLEPIHSTGEADDHFLIKIIQGLDPKEVETLVLVTYDSSFVEATRAAKGRGIQVWWVAADIPGLGAQAKETIKAEFSFVDLRDSIVEQIRSYDWRDDRQSRQSVDEKKVSIAFEAVVSARDHTRFMTMLQPLLEQFNIKVRSSS